MCACVGRMSAPPERLFEGFPADCPVLAWYAGGHLLRELEYNLFYLWFLDMDLLAHGVGHALFDEVVWAADAEGLLSDEHFSSMWTGP